MRYAYTAPPGVFYCNNDNTFAASLLACVTMLWPAFERMPERAILALAADAFAPDEMPLFAAMVKLCLILY